jgi:hypothetical protein
MAVVPMVTAVPVPVPSGEVAVDLPEQAVDGGVVPAPVRHPVEPRRDRREQ